MTKLGGSRADRPLLGPETTGGDKHQALCKVARVAMGDLIGASEPPEGVADNYPFNAPTWRDSLPEEWRADAEQVIRYVYHNERIPEGLR